MKLEKYIFYGNTKHRLLHFLENTFSTAQKGIVQMYKFIYAICLTHLFEKEIYLKWKVEIKHSQLWLENEYS